jgi:peptidoglycan/xylan/chitin deacetylase (PgdA/CDA1 family)
MARKLLTLFYTVCSWIGITGLFYTLNLQRLCIITYHNVIPDHLYDDALHLGVSHRLSEFRAQIDLLMSRFEVTTDLLTAERRSCAITFDDGYYNNILAAEYLEQKQVRGIFFVPAEPILSGRTLVIDQVLRWFSYVPPGTYKIADVVAEVREGTRQESYAEFYDWALRNVGLWDSLPKMLDTAFPFAKLQALPIDYERLRFQPMRQIDLARLREAGHGIGCHSYNHRPLAALSDDEMRADFEACEAHRGFYNLNVFSYPFGGVDEVDGRTVKICREFGYESAVANISDDNAADVMSLPRMSLPHSVNRHVLDAKLSGLESFIKKLVQLPA